MQQEFKLPDLGENIEGADVAQVLVSEGDVITPQQSVVEIESEKAAMEVPSPFGGRVVRVHVKKGQHIKVGEPLITVETAEGAEPGGPSTVGEPQQVKKEEEKRETAAGAGAAVAAGHVTPPAVAPAAPPRPTPPARKPAAPAPPPQPAPAGPAGAPAQAPPAAMTAAAAQEDVPAGPATRRLARELGADLRAVAAAYPGQRLSEEQVKAFVRQRAQAPPEARAAAVEPKLPDFAQWGPIERVELSTIQRKTAERVTHAWVAPHVTQFDLADVTALESLRHRHRQRAGDGVRLTVTAFVLKAVTMVLKELPTLNASLDLRGGALILKRYYHIGVAVDTEAGLIVPVLRDVDRKRVLEIAAELEELADRTRRRRIKPEELQGSTFTVTNLGGIGGTGFTPVLNYPEVAILGLARSREELVMRGGQLATRTVLPLCLSYDHRVVNGADGARFARKLAGLLEDPELLLLD